MDTNRQINGYASAARSMSLPKQPHYNSKPVQVFPYFLLPPNYSFSFWVLLLVYSSCIYVYKHLRVSQCTKSFNLFIYFLMGSICNNVLVVKVCILLFQSLCSNLFTFQVKIKMMTVLAK